MKKLAAIVLLMCSHAVFGQGVRYQSQANFSGLPNPTIRVCTETATGNPCTPLANIFSDPAMTIPLVNPFTGDVNGNYFFYAATTSKYHVQIFQNGTLIFEQPDIPLNTGFGCGTSMNPGIPYLNGTACLVDPSATLDGNGGLKVTKIGVGVSPIYKLQVETGTPGDIVARFKNTDPTGFGVKFTPGNDSLYAVGVENNSGTVTYTVDGSGNVTANGFMVSPTATFGAVNTTGPGFTQVFQSQAAPDATFRANNMAAGQMVWYGDSSTLKWSCQNKDGSSCSPGGAAWSGTTSGTNANAGTFAASGNTWDFTGVAQFRLRAAAGLTTSADGGIGYDTTNKNWHCWQNGADCFFFTGSAAGTYVVNDCTKIASVNPLTFADSGGACGAAGSASPIMFGSQQGVSLTATQFFSSSVVTTNEGAAQWPVPRAGTVSNLQCRSGGTAQSGSQSDVLTVRKGLAALSGSITSSSTTLTCTINSTNTNGCSDGTHSFTVAAGDVLDIQAVPTNSPNPGILNCSAQLL